MDRRLSLILITMFLDVLGVGIIIPVAPFYAQAYGASALDVGLLFTFYSAAQFLATPVLGGLSDRYGRRSILLMSLIGEVVGYLLMGSQQPGRAVRRAPRDGRNGGQHRRCAGIPG